MADPIPQGMFLPHTVALKDGQTALIRQAQPEDAEALIGHANEVGAEEIYIQTEKLDKTVEAEREWIAGFDGRSALLLVALLGEKIVGVADFERGPQVKNSHVAEVGIAIKKEARGQGIGRAMMKEWISWARSIGVRKLFLGVFGTNDRAIALYRSLGFVDEGRLRGQVVLRGEPADVVLMALWL